MAGRGRPPIRDALTPAEWRVLHLVRQHKTNSAIAGELGLTLNTVKFHVANMLAKLQVRDREALAAWKQEPRNWAKWFLGWPALAGGSTLAVFAAVALVAAATESGDSDQTPAVATASPSTIAVATAVNTTPVPPGPPVGTLAYVAVAPASAGSDVLTVHAAGGSETVLTSDPATRFSPVWSPDGSAVAYLELPASGLPAPGGESSPVSLRLVELSTGAVRVLKASDVSLRPSDAVLERPSWRPDGQRLVFSTRGFITSRVNRDGTDEREEMLGCFTPAWAPDGIHGSCTVISASQPEYNKVSMQAVSPEFRTSGYGGERVTSGWTQSYGNRGIPAHGLFNRDATWFSWWTYDDGTPPSVRVVPVNTKGLPPGEPVRVATGLDGRWSPDGKLLVFSTTTDLSFPPRLATGDIVVYEPATGVLTALVSGGSNRWPVWSPDGRHIAFVSDSDRPEGEVYLISVDGSGLTRLTFNERAESMLDWGPAP